MRWTCGGARARGTHLADPLRVLREEELEPVQLLRDALDVVEPVDADDDLDALEALLERGDAVLHAVLLEVLRVGLPTRQ